MGRIKRESVRVSVGTHRYLFVHCTLSETVFTAAYLIYYNL